MHSEADAANAPHALCSEYASTLDCFVGLDSPAIHKAEVHPSYRCEELVHEVHSSSIWYLDITQMH
jgi:hypothetical protein